MDLASPAVSQTTVYANGLIVLRSRIWFCSIDVIDYYSTFLMFYIITLMCCQWIAFVLECYRQCIAFVLECYHQWIAFVLECYRQWIAFVLECYRQWIAFVLECYHQWIAFVLECYFTMMEGFGFVDMLCLTVLLQFIVPYIVIYVSVLSLS